MPEDIDHQMLNSDNSVENKSELENMPSNEQVPIAGEQWVDKENGTLSSTGQCKINTISVSENDEEISQNTIIAEDTTGRKKSPETNFKANKTIVSKNKEKEGKKYPNVKHHSKVSDSHQTSQKSCTTGSAFVADLAVSDPTEMETDAIAGSRDSAQEITGNKRKADGRIMELEKPHKKFRCESDGEEQVHEEGKG